MEVKVMAKAVKGPMISAAEEGEGGTGEKAVQGGADDEAPLPEPHSSPSSPA